MHASPLRPHGARHLAAVLGLLAVLGGGAGCGRERSESVRVVKAALGNVDHVLSGTVFGGGQPLPGTLVEALVDGTATVAAASTTDASGIYALTLADGTYDLRVTPPASSGFSQQSVQNVVLAGADRRDDLVLIAHGGTVAGRVRGVGGVGIAGARLRVLDGGSGTVVAEVIADGGGGYEVSLGNGSYRVLVDPSSPAAGAPQAYWQVRTGAITVAGSTTFDVDLPVARLVGQVRDENGTALAGAVVSAETSFQSDPGDGYHLTNMGSTTTDAGGNYELVVFTGSNTFTVAAGPSSALLVQSGVAIEADTTRDFILAPAVLVSGQVRGVNGMGIGGARLRVLDGGSGTVVAEVIADGGGRYEASLGNGSYRFLVDPSSPAAGAPQAYWQVRTGAITVAGSTTFDVDLPVARLVGQVRDENGTALAGAVVSAETSFQSDPGDGYHLTNMGSTTTDAGGNYELVVFTGSNTFTVAAGPSLALLVQSGVIIETDTVRDFILAPAVLVSGQVRGVNGMGIGGARLRVLDGGSGTVVAEVIADGGGRYEASLGNGSYRFLVDPSSPAAGAPPAYWQVRTGAITVAGGTTFNIDLPVATVDGRVTDSNGAPVAGVMVSAETSFQSDPGDGYHLTNMGGTTTDASGSYRLVVFTGSNTFSVTPGAATGFATTVLSNVVVSGDFAQTIILQRPDLSAPVIVSGPLVIHLSDTSVSINWETNEPADSVVDFGVGATTQSQANPALVTRHQVALVGLLPATIYTYRASSTDGAGNGPTSSPTFTFRTQDPPGDVTPPIITSGPVVATVAQDRAVIVWTTDEPSSSDVHFGATEALGDTVVSPPGAFTRDHQVVLTGLAADTLYFFAVASTDPDGNGPTTSATVSLRTSAVPDRLAPQITSGPTIVAATHDTLTVVWTTDEPASSGVSYNDGSTFFLVSDDQLSTRHQVTLAALRPATTYHITVSSTDLTGNGPTLGGPIDGTTLASPDTAAPVITEVRVSEITGTGARITWSTDEPATTQVSFGVAAGAPTGLVGSAALVTSHDVLLSGLAQGTSYAFTVASTDGSGNAAVSNQLSFATTAAGETDADQDGVADGVDGCPATPSGERVDGAGCSIGQRCPCAGPRDGRGPWRNHGQYVVCVEEATHAFVCAGIIDRGQRRALVDAAQRSTCGDRKPRH